MGVSSSIKKWREKRAQEKEDLKLLKEKLGKRVPSIINETEEKIARVNSDIKEINFSLKASRREGVNRQELIPLLEQKKEELRKLNRILNRAKKANKFSNSKLRKKLEF